MATNEDNSASDSGPRKRIDDEEGKVDTQYKNRIIQNRIRVDDAEEALLVDAATDPDVTASRAKRVSIWGTMVKQYLRTIEPILRSDDVDEAQRYYEEVEIGSVTLHPPDKDGYAFSTLQYRDFEDKQLRRALDLPRGASLPEPEHIQFNGLVSIIEAPEILSHRWAVTVDDSGPPPTHEQVLLEQTEIPDKQLYVDALRYADQFLQEAGLGIDISAEGVPEWGFQEVGDDGT